MKNDYAPGSLRLQRKLHLIKAQINRDNLHIVLYRNTLGCFLQRHFDSRIEDFQGNVNILFGQN
jgi:hypothetical protein